MKQQTQKSTNKKSQIHQIVFLRLLPIAIASYMLFHEQVSLVYNHKEIEGIQVNWKSQPFTQFVNQQTRPANFIGEQIFVGSWPGTVEGCDCIGIEQCTSGVRHHKLNRGQCSFAELECGCAKVAKIDSVTLTVFPGENKFYGSRAKGLSFSEVYGNMLFDGECKTNHKKCGNLNSISKGICVPEEKECPVTAFIVESEAPQGVDYEFVVKGQNKNIYYTKTAVDNPILELKLAEHMICTDLSRALSPGRRDYPLMTQSANPHCFEDERYTEMNSEIGQKLMLDQNNVKYQSLPEFTVSDTFKYKKFGREMVEIKPACLSLVPNFLSDDTFLDQVKRHIESGYQYGLVFFGISLLINLGLLTIKQTKESRISLDHIISPLHFLLSLIFIVLVLIATYMFRRSRGVFATWKQLKCSDDFTNNRMMDASYSLTISTQTILFFLIALLIVTLGCDFGVFLYKLKTKEVNPDNFDAMIGGYKKSKDVQEQDEESNHSDTML